MPYISKIEAENLLKPFFPDIVGAVHDAWKEWVSSNVAADMQHKRVRADNIWNQFLAHCKRRLDSHPDVRFELFNGMVVLIFHDRILVRFKKGDGRLLSRNSRTQSALEFHDCTIDMFGGVGRLECVYVLNREETEIERVVIVQRHKNQILWAIRIDGDQVDARNAVIDFPPRSPSGTAADRVIKSKKQKREENNGNGTNGGATEGSANP